MGLANIIFRKIPLATVRKRATFRDATGGLFAKELSRNERRNFILMSPHYIFQTLFRGDTTGGVAKFRLFSQATPLRKISLLVPIGEEI